MTFAPSNTEATGPNMAALPVLSWPVITVMLGLFSIMPWIQPLNFAAGTTLLFLLGVSALHLLSWRPMMLLEYWL